MGDFSIPILSFRKQIPSYTPDGDRYEGLELHEQAVYFNMFNVVISDNWMRDPQL